MLIYLAAPYSQGDVAENVRQACLAGDRILELGHTPFIPHLFHLWHLISPKSYEDWQAIDLKYLERCDAVLRLTGKSKGADWEIRVAKSMSLSIYYSVASIPQLLDKVK